MPELAYITHIGKSFGKIAKVETFKDYIILSALNTFIFLKVTVGQPSIEIVCNVDFTSNEPLASPTYSLDFCLDASNLYFLCDSKSVCIKPICDQTTESKLS